MSRKRNFRERLRQFPRLLLASLKKDGALPIRQTASNGVSRIGVLLCAKDVTEPALRFLVLQMNCLQSSFEFEFLPVPDDDPFIRNMSSRSTLYRKGVRDAIPSFVQRYQRYLYDQISAFKLREQPPENIVIVSLIRFDDNYYSMREGPVSVLALGRWERAMAPPSLLEFVLTLLMREAVAVVSPSMRGSVHLGNKGCLFDFTRSLSEVRQKVLLGFVCTYCRNALESDGFPLLASQMERVLSKEWLGKPTDPDSPSGIASKLGHDLFITKGLKPTPWESVQITMRQEGVKQLITVFGTVLAGVLLAALLLLLNLRQPSDRATPSTTSPSTTSISTTTTIGRAMRQIEAHGT